MTKQKPLKTVEQVYELAQQKKAVQVGYFKRPTPAAFLINFQAHLLVTWLKRGIISEYKKEA